MHGPRASPQPPAQPGVQRNPALRCPSAAGFCVGSGATALCRSSAVLVGSRGAWSHLESQLNRTKRPRLTTGLQLVFTSYGKGVSRPTPLPPGGSRTYVAKPRYVCNMASVVYRCPTSGKNVQAWFDDDMPADNSLTYVSLRCPACARLHLVNRTGGTLQPPAD
jgi:hypothetical protein